MRIGYPSPRRMKFHRLPLALLLIATAAPGCTTMGRVGNSVESGARNVGRTTGNFFGNLFGKKKAEPTPRRRTRTRDTDNTPAPPTLESTPQEYVGQ